MGKESDVDGYMAALRHSRKDEIEHLRAIVLGASDGITERVKWNAPSFCWRGDDRVTMRLNPGDRLQLVFHRGAKARPADDFRFADLSGLIEWATADRGVLTVTGPDMLRNRASEIAGVVSAWMAATA